MVQGGTKLYPICPSPNNYHTISSWKATADHNITIRRKISQCVAQYHNTSACSTISQYLRACSSTISQYLTACSTISQYLTARSKISQYLRARSTISQYLRALQHNIKLAADHCRLISSSLRHHRLASKPQSKISKYKMSKNTNAPSEVRSRFFVPSKFLVLALCRDRCLFVFSAMNSNCQILSRFLPRTLPSLFYGHTESQNSRLGGTWGQL